MKRFEKPHPMFPPFPEGSRVIFYGDRARFLRATREIAKTTPTEKA